MYIYMYIHDELIAIHNIQIIYIYVQIYKYVPSGNLTWLLKMAIYSGFSH